MLPLFHLSVPADARYRVLAPEVAAKYAALAGCPEAEAKAFLAEVERAAAGLADTDADITLVFATEAGTVRATLTCGARTTTIRHTLPAAK